MLISFRLLLTVVLTAAVAVGWTAYAFEQVDLFVPLVLTGAVIGLLVMIAIAGWIRARLLERQVTVALRTTAAPAAEVADPTVLELALLRRALLGSRLGNDALSAIPLYLVVGLPGAGKTSFLEHCGLSYWYESARPDGRVTTRACDAAAFVEFDAHQEPRGAERDRKVLVDELVKATRARPLAGVLVCVPLGDLRGDASYEALRPVLDTVATGCGAHVPVHILVTQLDIVPGYGEFLGAINHSPSALGVRLPFATHTDHNRWKDPTAKLLDSVLEASVGLISGSAKDTPLRFGLGTRELAEPLAEWLRRLETPSLAAEPLLLRSVFLTSTRGQTGRSASASPDWLVSLGLGQNLFFASPSEPEVATPFTSLAMKAILDDAGLSRVTSRRLTRSVLQWTLPTGIPVFAGAATLSLLVALSDPSEPGETPPDLGPTQPVDPPIKALPPTVDPKQCPEIADFVGDWTFRTRVDGSAAGGGLATIGHYKMHLEVDAECRITADMTKLGWTEPSGKYVAHSPVQESSARFHLVGTSHPGEVEQWISVPKAVFSRAYDAKRFEIYFAFGVRADGNLTGAFEYLSDPNPVPKLYWGRLTGAKAPMTATWEPSRTACAPDRFVNRGVSERDPDAAFRKAVVACDSGTAAPGGSKPKGEPGGQPCKVWQLRNVRPRSSAANVDYTKASTAGVETITTSPPAWTVAGKVRIPTGATVTVERRKRATGGILLGIREGILLGSEELTISANTDRGVFVGNAVEIEARCVE
jgi:hypothetical protein